MCRKPRDLTARCPHRRLERSHAGAIGRHRLQHLEVLAVVDVCKPSRLVQTKNIMLPGYLLRTQPRAILGRGLAVE